MRNHPDTRQLSDFALGKLDPDAIEELGAHLAECSECLTSLQVVPPDAFVALVHDCETLGGQEYHEAPSQAPTIAAISSETPADSASRSMTVDAVVHDASRRTFELDAQLANHPRYHIVELLGAGGMGAVYKAEHKVMQRTVALKVINPQLVANRTAIERFHREVQAAARLQHPNIVTAHDADAAGDAHFLVMEYVAGADLHHVLEQKGPLPIAEACDYARQAALGLQHAHERGMVHRDIKPQNLMLTARPGASAPGVIKILDFGLAALTDGETKTTSLTLRGTIMGTPDYMAPEQARDAGSADIRADIYSLGCTLYCLLTGRTPFSGATAMDKIVAHMQREPQPVTDFRKDVPPELVQVLRKMMAKDREQRYQTPAEVAAALAPFTDANQSPQSKRGQNNPRLRYGLCAAAVAAMIVAAVLYLRTPSGSTIRIDIRDPEIKLSFAGDVYTFANKGQTIKVTPGEHTLMVQRGDLKFPTRKFTLGRDEHPSLVVELLDEKVVVTLGGRLLSQDALSHQNAGWVNLFNAKDLTGWKATGMSSWKVEDGVLVTRVAADVPQGGRLTTERDNYRDFHARLEAKFSDGSDSGFFFRVSDASEGYQVQIGNKKGSKMGSILRAGATQMALDSSVRPDTWFTLDVIARDNHIVIKVDGKTVVDWIDPEPWLEPGKLGLETGFASTIAHIRKIEVKEMPAAPGADAQPAPSNRWQVVDPFKDSTVEHQGSRALFKLPGKHRGMYATSTSRNTDAPRLMQTIAGDFDLQVKLMPVPQPQGNALLGTGSAILAAGLLLWQDEENFVRLFEQRVGNGKTLVIISDLIGGEYANHPLIKSHVVTDASKPIDLRVERRGSTVTGYVREHGGEWIKIGSVATKFPAKMDAGVFAMISQKVGAEVEFAELSLSKERPGGEEWRPLFNGKDLTGWKYHPNHPGQWIVENGILRSSKGASNYLYTERGDYQDFHLRAEVMHERSYTGIFFRSKFGSTWKDNVGQPGLNGYSVMINDPHSTNPTGTLNNGGVQVELAPKNLTEPGKWFVLEIIAQGNRLSTFIDGKPAATMVDPQKSWPKGHIALQQLPQFLDVRFRKIEIRELQPAPILDPVLLLTFDKDAFYLRDGRTYVRDLSGRGYDARCDLANFTAEGQAGGAVEIDARGGLHLPYGVIASGKPFTIAAWINHAAPWGTNNAGVFVQKDSQDKYDLAAEVGRDKLWCMSLGVPPPGFPAVYSPFDPAAKENKDFAVRQWAFVAWTRDVDGKLHFTVNDRTTATMHQPSGKNTFPEKARLGVQFHGSMDEVVVLDRALSADELKRLYEWGKGGRSLPAPSTNVPGLSLVRRFPGHIQTVIGMAVPPDASYVLSCGNDGRGVASSVAVWDPNTGALLRTLGERGVRSIAIAPDGKHAALGYSDRIQVMEVATNKIVQTMSFKTGIASALSYSADGMRLLAGSKEMLHLFDAKTGDLLKQTPISGDVLAVSLSPDGKQALAGSFVQNNGLAWHWDIDTNKPPKAIGKTPPYSLAFLPDGRRAILGGDEVRLIEVPSGKVLRVYNPNLDQRFNVALAAKANLIVAGSVAEPGSDGKTLIVWDIESGKEVARVSTQNHVTYGFDVTPDGCYIACGSGFYWTSVDGKRVMKRDGDNGIYLWRLNLGTSPAITAFGARQAKENQDAWVKQFDALLARTKFDFYAKEKAEVDAGSKYHMYYYRYVIYLAYKGEPKEYDQYRNFLLNRFTKFDEWTQHNTEALQVLAARTVNACLLPPVTEIQVAELASLWGSAWAKAKSFVAPDTRGMLDYRAGRFATAADLFASARSELLKGRDPWHEPMAAGAGFQLGMALARQGKVDAGLAIYRECEAEMMTGLERLEQSKGPLMHMHDWMHAAVLWREANGVLAELSSLPPPANAKPVTVVLGSKEGRYVVDGRPLDDVLELSQRLKWLLEESPNREVIIQAPKSFDKAVKQLEELIQQHGGKRVQWQSGALNDNKDRPVSAAPLPLLRDAALVMNFENNTFYQKDGQTWVRDLSGNGNDGLCTSMAPGISAVSTPKAFVGGGLACNGSYLRLPKTFLKNQKEYTLTLWVNELGKGMKGEPNRILYQERFGGDNSKGAQGHQFHLTLEANRVWASVWKNAGWTQARTPPDTLPNNQWIFLALRMTTDKDGSTAHVTIDEQTYRFPFAVLESNQLDHAVIGGVAGRIDELCIFPRALSDGELKQLYEWSKNGQPMSAAPVPREVDLLNLIDPARHALDPGVRKENDILFTPVWGGGITRVVIPYKSIPDEYDLRLIAERKGNDKYGLNLGFIMGGQQAHLAMDGGSPSAWAIERVDGKSMHNGNATRTDGKRFQLGKKVRVDVQVRRTGVKVLCDGNPVIDWQGRPERLSLWEKVALPDREWLFFFSQAEFAIHELTLIPQVSPTEER